jgi:hypothetical protein
LEVSCLVCHAYPVRVQRVIATLGRVCLMVAGKTGWRVVGISPIVALSRSNLLMHLATRCTMSVEDVVRREGLEETNEGGDCWSVVAALGSVLHWNVAPVGLVRDTPLCRRKRVVDPGLHQARQFRQCRHGHSGGWLDRGASFRALALILTGSDCCRCSQQRPPVAFALSIYHPFICAAICAV